MASVRFIWNYRGHNSGFYQRGPNWWQLTVPPSRKRRRCALICTFAVPKGRDEVFASAVWEALKGDHTDLRKQAIILEAHRAAIANTRRSA